MCLCDAFAVAANGKQVQTVAITPATSDIFHQLNLTKLLRTGANTVTRWQRKRRGWR